MRGAIWIFAGLVIGFLMGGLKPRQEAAELQRELARLEDALAKAEDRAARSGRRSWVPVPGLEGVLERAPEAEVDSRPRPEPAPATEDLEADRPAGGEDSAAPEPAALTRDDREDFEREFNAAIDAQRLRTEQSRTALAEQADLDDDQLAALDAAVDAMNDELAEIALDLGAIPDPEELSASELLGLTHDVTGALYDGQEALEEIVGADAMGSVDESAAQIWNYIDLESFRDVVEQSAGY